MQFERDEIYAIPSAAPTILPAVIYNIESEVTLELNIKPISNIMPAVDTSFIIPNLSCILPANSVAKANAKLVMLNEIAISLIDHPNLFASG